MMQMTAEQFFNLTPLQRGYAVYMCGEREDQPNIPNERKPVCDRLGRREGLGQGRSPRMSRGAGRRRIGTASACNLPT